MQNPSQTATARLALSYEACQLAETVRLAVPIQRDELGDRPAAALELAADVLAATARYLEAVVVYARMSGADWPRIAPQLGLSEGLTRIRYGTAETRFRGGTAAVPGDWWRTHLLREPLETALDLDDWVRRHSDEDTGTTPVSGPLSAEVSWA
ncbi:hypothetical protein FB561_3096 [Kribbella amoyensis]|uniref:Uncharacterized protein n=1 Tax=Kribbella amoyensis TaxID=996641 RepID=A0A561BT40_9ACTN|nr:hypothetical protein [Kribbella amoyensis]TWD81972.1 hypothetical protein FB561_3096 [Kribbella amoyensis]